MNTDELGMLLSMVTIGDRRTTGKYDIGYWALMAQEGRWTLPTAMRALAIYRSDHPGEWIDPGHITSIIRDARRQAAATFVVPKEPDDIKAADLPRWHRAQLAAHQDRLLDAWSSGEPMPVTPNAAAQITGGRGQLPSGMDMTTCPTDLKEQIAEAIARMGRDRPRQSVMIPVPRLSGGDPVVRAQARAELDAKRAEAAVKMAPFDAVR